MAACKTSVVISTKPTTASEKTGLKLINKKALEHSQYPKHPEPSLEKWRQKDQEFKDSLETISKRQKPKVSHNGFPLHLFFYFCAQEIIPKGLMNARHSTT